MRRLPQLTITSALVLSLSACGGDAEDSESADLTVWFMENSVPGEAMDWLVEEFESGSSRLRV